MNFQQVLSLTKSVEGHLTTYNQGLFDILRHMSFKNPSSVPVKTIEKNKRRKGGISERKKYLRKKMQRSCDEILARDSRMLAACMSRFILGVDGFTRASPFSTAGAHLIAIRDVYTVYCANMQSSKKFIIFS